MTKEHTPEEIKYRLSDLGVQIGNIAIEYITDLEKENEEQKKKHKQEILDLVLSNSSERAKLEEENAELKSGCGMCYRKDKVQLTKAKEIILRLYNAGRDVLMCRAEEKAYDNLSYAINDKSIEQFLSEVEK